jgi:hypothetical protein
VKTVDWNKDGGGGRFTRDEVPAWPPEFGRGMIPRSSSLAGSPSDGWAWAAWLLDLPSPRLERGTDTIGNEYTISTT